MQTIHPVLGVRIAAEVDDGSYDRKDYDYPSSIEADIVNRQGGLFSPYSLNCFDSATETDIEHIVATAEAHASGMYARTEEDRSDYGKDLDNLTLAAPSVNRNQKSDKDPAEWMPENNKCWYVGKWVEIKKKYNLTMDQAEADSVAAVYQECDSFDMIVPVCAAGLAESEYYDFRWSRWGDSKEDVQSTELDTLTYSQVDSTLETGSVTGVLMFSVEISDTVTVSYSLRTTPSVQDHMRLGRMCHPAGWTPLKPFLTNVTVSVKKRKDTPFGGEMNAPGYVYMPQHKTTHAY